MPCSPAGSRPTRCRRRSSSRALRPASTSSALSPSSTRTALPALPLARTWIFRRRPPRRRGARSLRGGGGGDGRRARGVAGEQVAGERVDPREDLLLGRLVELLVEAG